ncbi:MAG TPA: hypothetical protein VHA73_10495 [Acidimicrobiales bacterium]|jgi:hypothetical protein|nr:hypothetical protein [Acidimicrobiales bacterium]
MRRVPLVAVALTLTLTVVGATCSSSGSDPRVNPPLTTTPDPNAQAKADIRKVLEGFNTAYARAVRNPQTPPTDLRQYAEGQYLAAAERAVQDLKNKRQVVRDAPHPARIFVVRSIQVDGAEANANTCRVSDEWIVEAATGHPLNTDVGIYTNQIHLVRHGSGWRINRVVAQQLTKGVSTCG